MNPFQTPAVHHDDGPRIEIVAEKNWRDLFSNSPIIFIIFANQTIDGHGLQQVHAILAMCGVMVAGAVLSFIIRKAKDDRIRNAQPRFAGKRALWGGSTQEVTRWWWLPHSGYLFLTVETLVFTRTLDEEGKGGQEFFLLDDISKMKATRRVLTLFLITGVKRKFRTSGSGQWKGLLEMGQAVREERRRIA